MKINRKLKKFELNNLDILLLIYKFFFEIIFNYINKRKLIVIFILINIISYSIINDIYVMNDNFQNNKGFLKINITHKSNYSIYNYSKNVIVYKDIYNNMSYVPINKANSIIKSKLVSNKEYFKLCQQKILLDKTSYKRSIKPKISVIIPFYNQDKFSIFIPLRSIQNQSFKDIEIIFVDDGSSENKFNELVNEMKNDNRIILIKHKKNKGTLMTRVDGIRFASGEFILNLDQDDLFFNNLVFENLYNKAKKLNVDILQFSTICYKNNFQKYKFYNNLPKNVLITQPQLRVAFLNKKSETRLSSFSTRMIWDKLVKRKIYLESINELGDQYLNHRIFLYEDTIMMFELSQIAHSYYYYNINGYRLNVYSQGESRDFSSNKTSILAMNQLYFIKLLLYKISPSYDRYHIYRAWGFNGCGSDVIYLDIKEIDLLKEVLELIDELERIYKNTDNELLECSKKIKKYFEIT